MSLLTKLTAKPVVNSDTLCFDKIASVILSTRSKLKKLFLEY